MQHPQNPTSFYRPIDVANLFNVSQMQIHRLRKEGQIPPIMSDNSGKQIGFPADEIDLVLKARESRLPKAARIELANRLYADRNIDLTPSALVDQFLTIH